MSNMTYSGFEKKLNQVIYNMLNVHRQFRIYKMLTDLGYIFIEYDEHMFFEI